MVSIASVQGIGDERESVWRIVLVWSEFAFNAMCSYSYFVSALDQSNTSSF